MFAGRPIIGIAGGIGSGKSFVADLFGELGCVVLRSDDDVHAAYRSDAVKAQLRHWWGDRAFTSLGDVDRGSVASIVFSDGNERNRLERLLHPLVNAERKRRMQSIADDARRLAGVVAWVWDIPLLFEVGLNRECDRVVFVDAPDTVRAARVANRGWNPSQLQARENLQWGLDKKRAISDYYLGNADGTPDVRRQVRDVLSRILADFTPKAAT
jgi:dephospho-CoA kinase